MTVLCCAGAVAALADEALADDTWHTEVIRACGDGGGWPPYTFVKDGRVQGYDVDVLTQIFAPLGIEFTVHMPPWRRCLRGAEEGFYHIALSSSYSAERDRTYLLTDSYYTLQPSYIYDQRQFPDGLEIRSAADVLNYRACGLLGYNYDGFGVDTDRVNTMSQDFGGVSRMTLAGRCDLFLARFEILAGFALTGDNYLVNGLRAQAIPGVDGDPFYMLISRAYPQRERLRHTLNEGLKRLRQEGALQRMLRAYLPSGAGAE